jgi:predicted ATPase/DNA-binding CsgD family transcriptional regulator
VADLLRELDPRLLTLVGAAGTGKTRLAIESAAVVADAFPDGVFFVDLAPLTDTALVVSTIARTLEVQEDGSRPLIQTLASFLAARRLLLLLDNFEQLLPAAEYLAELLQTAPTAKMLVTSRSPLNLRWEQQLHVPPLPVPDLARMPSAGELGEIPSVALFLQRAQRVDASFRLNDSNARTIAEICVQLDGLPLAIELAAARSRVLPAQSLLARLQRRLDFLEGGSLDQPRRQRTLRAALDWSYDLLSSEEKLLFVRLGVFVGGFALDALGEVCDPDGQLGPDVLPVLESLVDKSLVRQDRGQTSETAEPRFAMLETIREYALERLDESGDRAAVRKGHAAYYLGAAEHVVAHIRREQQATWLRSLESEHDNIRAALAWCIEQHEPELGLRAAGLLHWFWTVRAHLTEGRRWLASLLSEATNSPPPLRAEGLRIAGSLALAQSDYPAESLFEESLTICRGLADPAALVGPLSGLGATAMQEGDNAMARARFEETLAIQRTLGDDLGVAETLNNLANLAHQRGDLDVARSLYQESLVIDRVIGYRPDVVLHNLATIALELGDLVEARRLFEESIAIKRALDDNQGLALSLSEFGEVAAAQGNQTEAQRLFSEALDLQVDLGDRAGIAFVLERWAAAAAASSGAERALHLAGAASALRESIGAPLSSEARSALAAKLEPARGALSSSAAAAAWDRGRAMSVEVAVSYALSLDLPAPLGAAGNLPGHAGVRLTPREREVAVLVARGLSNRRIAAELVLSERTADVHVSNILRKLDFVSRAQLAAWVAGSRLAPRSDEPQ